MHFRKASANFRSNPTGLQESSKAPRRDAKESDGASCAPPLVGRRRLRSSFGYLGSTLDFCLVSQTVAGIQIRDLNLDASADSDHGGRIETRRSHVPHSDLVLILKPGIEGLEEPQWRPRPGVGWWELESRSPWVSWAM